MDLFLKGLPLQPYTEYVLEFRVLGGACFAGINRLFASRGAELHYTQPCTAWETHVLHFTTNSLAYKPEAVPDWCISFGKKMETQYATAGTDTYLDDIRLYAADEPQSELLSGGDFEAPRLDAVYDAQWRQCFFGPAGDTYGVDIVCDPKEAGNHCLKLPTLLQTPSYPEAVTLRAESFGWYKDNIDSVTENEPFGLPYHRLLLVVSGTATCETLGGTLTATDGELLYLPPALPVQYTYQRGEGTAYYWLDCSGEPVKALLSECGLTAPSVLAVRDMAALTGYVDTMLVQPRSSAFYPYVLSSWLQLMLAELHHQLTTEENDEQHPVIEQAAACLREFSSEPVDNTALAARFGLSTRHFIRLFKQYKGCTPHQYYLQAMMEKACTLLSDTAMTVQEVSFALGMEDAFYFSRLFRKFYGISPTEYRSLKN